MVVISDAEDRIVLKRRVPNEFNAILAALAPHCEDLTGVVAESTYYGRLGIMHGLSVILSCDAHFLRMPGSASPTVELS
jgi:hypothetical protein